MNGTGSYFTQKQSCLFLLPQNVLIQEPGFTFAAVNDGKKDIVGANETVEAADHDFSKVSIIPDAVPNHDIPQFQGTLVHQFKNDIIISSLFHFSKNYTFVIEIILFTISI